MHVRKANVVVSLIALAITLGACGGGAGGSGLNSAPPPILGPTPTATPTAASPPFGLTASREFATHGVVSRSGNNTYHVDATPADAIEFSWSAEAKAYEIRIPGFEPGKLELTFPGSNALAYHIIGESGDKLPLTVTVYRPQEVSTVQGIDLTYSSVAYYQTYPSGATNPFIYGVFAFGIPTATGNVPTSGTGHYLAVVQGLSSEGLEVRGDARLTFDFGAGSLTGHMRPRLFSDWDGIDQALGQYDFTQTLYAAGSTSFSGKFIAPNSSMDSAFHGRFTGPKAAELIANWHAPYRSPFDGAEKTMAGFWIGKKN